VLKVKMDPGLRQDDGLRASVRHDDGSHASVRQGRHSGPRGKREVIRNPFS
jgi:hypothetical protein